MIFSICPNPAIDSLARLETLRPGEVNRIQAEERFPGGKGVHVAMAVAELGEKSELLGFWAGPSGTWIRECLRGLGVPSGGVDVSGWNRTCYTFASSGPLNETELLGVGPQVSAAQLEEFERLFTGRVPELKVAVCSGSLPMGAAPELYARLVKAARKAGCSVILDASGDAFAMGLAAFPWGVHLNRAEAAAFTGEADPLAALARFPNEVHCVALTAGADGLYLRFAGEVMHANVQIVPTASPVGSGDCLTAGLAVALCRGLGAEETARLAVACGAANCLRHELGMFHRRDVERLLPEVKVRRVKGSK